MKRPLIKWLASGLVISLVYLSASSWAHGTDAPEASHKHAEHEELGIKNLLIQHKIGGKKLPVQTVAPDPLVLLEQLTTDLKQQLQQQQKPLTINTEVKLVLDDSLKAVFKNIPALTINTIVDKNGQGKSDFALPAYKAQFTDDGDNYLFDWKGLTGALNFDENFKQLAIDSEFSGLMTEEDGEKAMIADKTQFSGTFDEFMIPEQLKLVFPQIKMSDDEGYLNVAGFDLDTAVQRLEGGLELYNFDFSLKELVAKGDDDDEGAELKDTRIKLSNTIQNNTVSYGLLLKIKEALIPSMVATTDDKPMSYTSTLEIINLDSVAVAMLQTTAREIQEQQMAGNDMGSMAGFMMLGKFMEAAPQLIAQSPGISLKDLQLVAPEGILNGGFNLNLQGDKATNWQNPATLIAALQGQANFDISKPLLKNIFATSIQTETGQDAAASAAMADQMIKSYVAQKFLVEQADKYVLKAQLDAGKLMVNGQPMPLPLPF